MALSLAVSLRRPYRATRWLRLPRCAQLRVLAPVGAAAFALVTGGCSFSYQLDSLFGAKEKSEAASAEHTGTLRPKVQPVAAVLPPDTDLAFARAAAVTALGRDETTASVPWQNPKTGARGTVTTLETAYTLDGFPCRDFLASYVRDAQETWMQGEACRVHKGKWEVRSMKPWSKT